MVAVNQTSVVIVIKVAVIASLADSNTDMPSKVMNMHLTKPVHRKEIELVYIQMSFCPRGDEGGVWHTPRKSNGMFFERRSKENRFGVFLISAR